MTFRYCELACGRSIPNRGIDWANLVCAIPVENGKELQPNGVLGYERVWNRQVIGHHVENNVLYCELEREV